MSLAHHIDEFFLREAYARTRKSGAPGVDGQTANEYAVDLEGNLRSLLDRFKSGLYRAPPVRRVHIPKGGGLGSTRPIGIPSFEDKVLQRAVTMVLEAIYEQDFLDCSYGFRPGRSAHQASDVLRHGLARWGGGWVLEVDIRSFFDELDRGHLATFLDRRVRDGVIRRTIGKWLEAGVREGGELSRPEAGTPQGGVISPLLANIYLHEVVDRWFEDEVRPRLVGDAFLVRYADDLVIVFETPGDARRVAEVLPKRLARFGLRLHPEKTRLTEFRRPPYGGDAPRGSGPGTFDFLGFTYHWGKKRQGGWTVKRRTASSRMSKALREVRAWCRRKMHAPVGWQQQKLRVKLLGHYAYFGVPGNYRCLAAFHRRVTEAWRHWLDRRSSNAEMTWEKFVLLLDRYPLPRPRIVHRHRRA